MGKSKNIKPFITNQNFHFDQNESFPQFCHDVNQRKSSFGFVKFWYLQPYLITKSDITYVEMNQIEEYPMTKDSFI